MPDLVEIGTATDYSDLLDKLVTFAESTTWWTTLQDDSEMTCLQGEGAGSDEIIVAFKKYSNVGADSYGWFINGFTGYTNGLTFTQQPGALPNWSSSSTPAYPAMPLWNSTIPYWFIVSSRRIIVVAKISTVYHMCYAGWFLPFASPGQYPYPLMVGGSCARGSTSATPRFSIASAQASAFWSGRDASPTPLALRTPSGAWASVVNNLTYGEFQTVASVESEGIYPYNQTRVPAISLIDQALDGSPVLTPLQWSIANTSSGFKGHVGEIDGVFHVSGATHAAEDVITIDGEDYLVVQDVFRTAVENYCAVHIGATESSS